MKTALITGVTAGIGEACARRFVEAGWRVIGTGRRKERLDAMTERLGADSFHGAACDLRDEAERDAAIEARPAAFRDIDLLVNNAGLMLGGDLAPDCDLGDWKVMIDTNITALVSITHSLLPMLIERAGGIVNISSIGGNYAMPTGNVYSASKAFVTHFSQNLRSDLHGSGVRVTVIEPGMVETEFSAVRSKSDAPPSSYYEGAEALLADDLAEAVLWVSGLPPRMDVTRMEIWPTAHSFGGFRIAGGRDWSAER